MGFGFLPSVFPDRGSRIGNPPENNDPVAFLNAFYLSLCSFDHNILQCVHPFLSLPLSSGMTPDPFP